MSTAEKAYDVEARLTAHVNGTLANIGIADVTTTGNKSLGNSGDQIPAGVLAGGEHWECDAAGQFATGATAPASMTFTIWYGGLGSTALINFAMPAAGLWANAAAAAWRLQAEIVWQSATECTTVMTLFWRSAAGLNNSVSWTAFSDISAIDTTGAHVLTLGFAFTTPGTMTLSTSFSHFTRKR
jgi:hypothetical protein